MNRKQTKQFGDLVDFWRFLLEEEEAMEREEQKEAHGNKVRDEILAAWKGGERSIKEIMQITGRSYQTVRKYIPESKYG